MKKDTRLFRAALTAHSGPTSVRCCLGMDLMDDLFQQHMTGRTPYGVGFDQAIGDAKERLMIRLPGGAMYLRFCPVCGHDHDPEIAAKSETT